MRPYKLVILVLLGVSLASCGAKKNLPQAPQYPTNEIEERNSENLEEIIPAEEEIAPVTKIAEHAMEYLGTGYKYGGTTREGMDCSGLVFTAFLKENINLPRTSRDMSLLGDRLNLEEVIVGDLIFFVTNKKRPVINHVGLVVEIKDGGIYFIHSSTSRGVIISSLEEKYWQDHFVMARRIL